MIRITHVFPPIPDRRFDYCAYMGDGDEGTLQGWGETPKEALEDLRRVMWEHDLEVEPEEDFNRDTDNISRSNGGVKA